MERQIPGHQKFLREEMEKAQKELNNQEQLFVRHIKDLHGGSPLSSCHTCNTYVQVIKLKQDYIGLIWNKLSED